MSGYASVPQTTADSDWDEEIELVNSPRNSNSETTEKDTHDSESDEEILTTMGRRKTWKNICVLAVVFILLFMAFNGLVDLQSSLFIDAGMGVVTQSVVYASFSVSCLFLPKVAISKFGHKRVISMSMIGYILWMAANGYATWITMTVTSFLVGLSAAPLWTAQTTYITHLAESYAKARRKAVGPTVSLFFGVFNGLFQIAAFCGNVISWAILKAEKTNATISSSSTQLEVCGAADCAGSNNTNANEHYKKVPDPILWTLVAVYLCIGILGLVLSIVFLDDLRHKKKGNTESLKFSVLAALRQHKDIRHLLLIPMTVCNGMEMVFVWADFNKSYVTCAIGVWMVGLVFLPSVTLNCVASLSVGKLSEYVPRMVFVAVAFVINVVVLCFLLFWKPNPDQLVIFYLVPGLMGLAGGILHVTLNSIIAVTFKDQETAFACIRLWGALGASVAFGINKFLCVRHKIFINCCGLAIWFICYMIFERVVKRKKT